MDMSMSLDKANYEKAFETTSVTFVSEAQKLNDQFSTTKKNY